MSSTPTDDPPPLAELIAHASANRRGALAVFGLLGGLGLITAAIVPAQYRATAEIAIMPSPEFTVRQDAGSHAYSGSALAFDQIMQAEAEILESDTLHEATIRDLGGNAVATQSGVTTLYADLDPAVKSGLVLWAAKALTHFFLAPWRGDTGNTDDAPMETALRRFSNHLRVLPTKDGNVIGVTFVHTNAGLAARTLNMLLDRYAERREHIYNDPQLAVAERETEARAGIAREADAAVASFKAAHGLSDLGTERDLLLKRRSQAAQALADAESQQAQSQARLSALDMEMRTLKPSALLYQEHDTDLRLQAIDQSLLDLRGRLVSAREHYRDGSRLVTGLQTEVAAREMERRRMGESGSPSIRRTGRSPALDPLLVDRAQAMADGEASKAQARLVRTEIEGLNAELRSMDADEVRLAELTQRKAAADESFANSSRAAAEQRLTEAEDARRLANIRVIQPARMPQRQTNTRLLICLAGLLLAGLASTTWIVVRFMTRTAFLTGPGLEHATGLPVLGVFAREAAGAAVAGG